mmetsp:Transcript_8855/g.17880  ORF Transcript_8855/g.17880 Transcript_8855/m.17880 type:complete len:444 (-) Transcript_8855:374-1705(-)|eukprot:CAMPEP_0184683522 /NCGR_PEP_ID=MMETSP0312-20130426/11662_1 /TAXON_ID=31354 /ORGANISM="Compsopogon coeruleus, Strain SAG 36.94" /LENGTH=443 /DNA_ID=CAMNT_0027135943 /DNA_START=121 /DNA_END=1452 /DNA_ORIENTATION=+
MERFSPLTVSSWSISDRTITQESGTRDETFAKPPSSPDNHVCPKSSPFMSGLDGRTTSMCSSCADSELQESKTEHWGRVMDLSFRRSGPDGEEQQNEIKSSRSVSWSSIRRKSLSEVGRNRSLTIFWRKLPEAPFPDELERRRTSSSVPLERMLTRSDSRREHQVINIRQRNSMENLEAPIRASDTGEEESGKTAAPPPKVPQRPSQRPLSMTAAPDAPVKDPPSRNFTFVKHIHNAARCEIRDLKDIVETFRNFNDGVPFKYAKEFLTWWVTLEEYILLLIDVEEIMFAALEERRYLTSGHLSKDSRLTTQDQLRSMMRNIRFTLGIAKATGEAYGLSPLVKEFTKRAIAYFFMIEAVLPRAVSCDSVEISRIEARVFSAIQSCRSLEKIAIPLILRAMESESDVESFLSRNYRGVGGRLRVRRWQKRVFKDHFRAANSLMG